MKTRANINNFLVMSVFLLATLCTAAAGGTIYVDADAPGPTHDGTSWTNAYKYMQDALTGASSGDEIRVAEGVYKPDQGAGVTAGDRTATFQLISGVAIYGGFGGESILSGDLNGDDGPDFTNNGENSYHVVTGSGTDETAILDGFTITAGNANGDYYTHGQGGGMYNRDYSSPTVTNCTFTDNSALYLGGGMCNWNNSSPTVKNCTFRGNSASSGGGMCNGHYIYGQCSPTVTNCTFSGNSASGGAGMCNWNNSSPTLTDCTFSGNSADHSGGGMDNWDYSSPILADCTFTDNSALYLGGGMYNREYSSPTLTDCTFSENSANNGGGMYNGHSYGRCSPTLTNCEFTGNSATRGGGISNDYRSSPTLTNCKFTGNSASSGGGMINWNYSTPTLTNCTFSENSASSGGGMHNAASSPTVTNCTFSENSATAGGGMCNSGSASSDSEPTLTNCTFSGNSADIGGGMYNVGGTKGIFGSYDTPDPTLTNCTFRENSATKGGGMYNIFYSSPTVANCTFIGNSAGAWGGGMVNNDYSSPTVTNCTFSGNSATNGGAILNTYGVSSPTVTNCTFSGNIADASGGGIESGMGCCPTVTNCIFWGDTPDEVVGGRPAITYSDVQGGTGQPWFGTGCIDTDPLFADAANGDYHLLPGSPCIDAGTNEAPGLPETDFDGNPRIFNGIVDMGAYESEEQGPSIITVEIDIKPGSYPSSINLRSKGVTPVAIHTTPDFDATTVDPSTVQLNLLVAPLKWESYDCDELPNPLYGDPLFPDEPEMIGDGDIDLVLYFDTQELAVTGALEVGDELAILTGETYDGVPIEGIGDVRIVVKGKGKK